MNKEINFDDYQKHVKSTDKTTNDDVLIYGLVGEVGEILTAFKKHKLNKHPKFKDELKEELGDVLWYLSALANKNNLSLQDIAQNNKNKSTSLCDKGKLRLFDKDYPENEQLLRQFDIEFIEDTKRTSVKIKMGDCFLGETITDNSHDNDCYRYHDAFHLAYAAVLGWSPVVRRMLKRKRKSDEKVDEIEDGARAAIVEEAISIFIFNHADAMNYYEGISNPIDLKILKTIMLMTKKLEVKVCTAQEWQKAIRLGYKMFNKLKKNKGGKLHIDLDKRSIIFNKNDKNQT